MKKIVSAIILILLLSGTLTLTVNIQPVKSEPKTWTVDDDGLANFSSIQKAINTASPGDTIFVSNGTYNEHVIVNKTVQLVGEDKRGTVINGSLMNDVVKITANNVTIHGFTIQRSGVWFSSGILLSFCNGGNISDNIIVMSAVGIQTEFSYNNKFVGNEVWLNVYGIWLTTSDHNILRGNLMHDNELNFGVSGASNDVDASNKVNGKPIYYWISQHDRQIPSDAGFVALVNSSRISIRNLELKDNIVGIFLAYSSDILIQNVTFKHNRLGIWLDHSTNITVIENLVTDNQYGFYLEASLGNRIFHNSFINNDWSGNVFAKYRNMWDNGYPSGGNYWSDYTGKDLHSGPNQNKSGSDGIGDTAFAIPTEDPFPPNENNTDIYPLMKPYVPGDYNHDGIVNMTDVNMARLAWQSRKGELNYNPSIDYNMDDIINIKDLAIIGINWQKHT